MMAISNTDVSGEIPENPFPLRRRPRRFPSPPLPGSNGEEFIATVHIPSEKESLTGDLVIPEAPRGLVIFAHGSGSSRHSSRNKSVAQVLQNHGIATLLIDLLTPGEEKVDAATAHLRFNIPLLAGRLGETTRWLRDQEHAKGLPVGYFGASTGGAAALVAAASQGSAIQAVVSRGGRPDLAGDALERVTSPTLLIVGGLDHTVEELNRMALGKLRCAKELVIIPGATHLFEEPGKLEKVAEHASTWFADHFTHPGPASSPAGLHTALGEKGVRP